MSTRSLLTVSICLMVTALWIGSVGLVSADGGSQQEVLLAQFEAADDGEEAGADDGDAEAAEDDGDAAAEDGDAEAAEGEGAPAAEAVEPGPEPVPPVFDFEDEALSEHWTAFGQDAQCEITNAFGAAQAGQGALLLTYMPGDGNVPGVTVAPLDSAPVYAAFEMSIKTDELSSIRFTVVEEDGSEYENYLASPGGEWTEVAVALDEMMLAEQSEDENGALDPEQVTSVTVMDLCNLPGEMGRALGMKEGLQHLWLDNLMLSDGDVVPRSSSTPDGAVTVESFEAASVLALPIGGAEMQTVPAVDGAHALEIRYRLGGHRWAGLVRGVSHLDLTGSETFAVNLKAEDRARLVAVLEERDGSKYETNIELDPEAGWLEIALPIEQFILDPTTDDENRQVDLDQLRVIILVVDTFNASVDETGHGSVLVDQIVFR